MNYEDLTPEQQKAFDQDVAEYWAAELKKPLPIIVMPPIDPESLIPPSFNDY